MTNKELNLILTNIVNEKDTIYKFLESQDKNDIACGLFNIPTELLKAKLSDFLNTVKIPSIVSQYDFDFFDDYITLDVIAIPKKLLGKIDVSFTFEIQSLSFSGGNIKAELKFNERVNNKDLKGAMINSVTKLKSLLEIALEKIELPSYVKTNIFGQVLKLSITPERLDFISNLNLTFIELKKDAILFTYSINEDESINSKKITTPTCKTSTTQKQLTGGFLRNIINESDRF